MRYLFDLAGLATLEKPKGVGQPYDHIAPYINLALAERIEALVEQLVAMNASLAQLAALPDLVKATQENKPVGGI